MTPIRKPADGFVSLAKNEIDVMCSGINAAHFNLTARNLEARIVAAMGIQPPMTTIPFMVRTDLWNDGSVRSGKDFRGRRIVLIAAGNASEIKLVNVLAAHGMTIKDVDVEFMSYNVMPIAFANKSIDIAIPSEPFATFIRQQGLAKILPEESKVSAGELTTVLLFSDMFVRERREVGVRFLRTLLQTTPDLIGENWRTARVLDVLAKWTGLKAQDIADGEFSVFDPNLDPSRYLDSIQRQEKALLAMKRLQYDAPLKPDQYLDASLVKDAARRP